MSKVYSKTRLNSDGHGSLVSEISGPKATTLAWPKEAPWGLGGPAGLPSRTRGLGAKGTQPKSCVILFLQFDGVNQQIMMIILHSFRILNIFNVDSYSCSRSTVECLKKVATGSHVK
jgi:hypothetical protein